jgi:hypothetical protein
MMADDFENVGDIENLSPSELKQRIEQELQEHTGLDAGDINVHVENGMVRLIGRVGTEGETRIAEHLVTDKLGIVSVSNELVVDELRRATSPEAIDEHLVDEERRSELLLGDKAVPLSPEAEHLEENIEGELYGTTDVQKSIQDGVPYIPPERATPEGNA